jgi:prepilin-type N-terminal cleavage/methylation domain-containing protein
MPASDSRYRIPVLSPENRRTSRRGLTLFELVMALLIMSVLTAIILPSMSSLLI